MLINDIVKNFISEQIRFDNYKNIQLTTKRIKECNSGVTNSMIFDELINLENGNIIQIQQAARSGKLFNNRKNWIKRKQSICRYVINILKPEYFEKTSVSENNWAIKAHIDTENWNFVIQFNGIEEKVYIDLKPAKEHQKTKLMKFWEQAQNNPNKEFSSTETEDLFARPAASISSFFARFCKDLKKYFIKYDKKKVIFIPIIYPDVLRAAHVHKFVLFEGTDIRQSYECKFDEDGKFLGWRKS